MLFGSRFGIQDSGFRIQKESLKMHFKKSTRLSVHNSPIVKLLFHTKICSRKFPKCGLLYFWYA